MRSSRTTAVRGFTLVELMIVVAIIGVLAALAIFGVRKYLTAAKTAEARNTIGAISRSAVAAYDRDRMKGELLGGGTLSAIGNQHTLCDKSTKVPAASVPAGKKYQPATGPTADWNAGTDTEGWRCLRFAMTEPHYYQYAYTKGATAQLTHGATIPSGASWLSEAAGDLNGDTIVGGFVGLGAVENDQAKIGTQLLENNGDE